MKRAIQIILGKTFLYYLTGTLALIAPALWNSFPLLFSDLGTYVSSGFYLITPRDRPISYGILLRLFSLNGYFIWGMLLMQAGALLWTMKLFAEKFFPAIKTIRLLVIIVLLSLLSSVSWRTSELLPDILSPVCFLLLLSLIFKRKSLTKREAIAAFVIYFCFNSTHLAHLSVHVILLIALLPFYFWAKKKVSFSISSWLILFLCTFNLILISGAAIAKSRHILQMSGLVENGVLNEYLKNECPKHNYKICDFADTIAHMNGGQFIWSKNSPVDATGDWPSHAAEYNAIIRDIFFTPKYLKIFLVNSWSKTWNQFFGFDIGYGNDSYKKGSRPYDVIVQYMPSQFSQMVSARQYLGKLDFSFWRILHRWVFYAVSALLLIFVFLFKKSFEWRLFTAALFFLLVINAWTVTTFSCFNDRYQSKYTWLVVFFFFLFLTDVMLSRFKKNNIFTPQ